MENRFKRIAVLVDTSTGWGRRMIKGVGNYALKQGNWQLSVEQRGIDENLMIKEGWQGDGVIARISDKRLAEQLLQLEIPVVNVSSIQLKGYEFPSIYTDENALAEIAVEHFSQRGFQTLAYFGQNRTSYEIKRGIAFQSHAHKNGFQCEMWKGARHNKQSWKNQRKEIKQWLDDLEKPAGVLTWNTLQGRSILNVCLQTEITVPHEIAVLSSDDDSLLNEVCYPPMSGIVTSAEQTGHEAGHMLDSLIEGKPLGDITPFPPESINTRLSTDTFAIKDEILRNAIRFIRSHVREPIQVSDVAASVGVSRRSLERRFEKELGTSPAQETKHYRLEYAKKLLRDTELKVADIAAMSGYCSNEYMIRIFQTSLGKTPLKYRTWMRGKSK